ncbi:MAG: DUF1801 domain-containing protein [Hyphomonadaceae bacterium]
MTTAQQHLEKFLKKYSPEIEKLGHLAISHMRKRLPGAICLVYDNYNALAVGFGPDAKPSTTPMSIALYPRWVTLFFLFGATLPDPDGLLEGKGSRVRSIRLKGIETLGDPAVDELITAAVLQAGWVLKPRAKGDVVIQSISPKQRPRRP